MKVNNYIKTILIASCIISISNVKSINADSSESSKLTIAQSIDHSECKYRGHHRGKAIFEESIKELKKSGVLTSEDIKNIESYMQKEHEQREAEIKKKRDEKIDNLVKENVLTIEKANKLKEAIDKNVKEDIDKSQHK